MSKISIVDSLGGHFGSSEDVDFPKVLNKMACPGECAEKSVDLHEVVKKNSARCRNKCNQFAKLSKISIVDSLGGHFGSSEDVDFPKVLNKMAHPGECAEKSVDLHEVVKKTARAAEISATNLPNCLIMLI